MTPEDLEILERFEKWYCAQFSDKDGLLLREKARGGGYLDPIINSMWVGFYAGALTS